MLVGSDSLMVLHKFLDFERFCLVKYGWCARGFLFGVGWFSENCCLSGCFRFAVTYFGLLVCFGVFVL